MPDKKFTDFTLKSPLATGDFAVGYYANGSQEWRAYIKDIIALQTYPSITGVFGRSGQVVAESGDYSAFNITNDSLVNAPTVRDALNLLKQNLEATGSATANSVSSVFGRQGAISAQSGDYNATGITSNILAPTVHAALESLNTRLEATGALSSAPVISVFGRQGAVTANSGDYSGEYITNTSNVVGGTVTHAFNTINTRIGSTGSSLFNRDAEISGYLYNLQTGFVADFDTRLLATGQAIPSVPVTSVFDRVGAVVGQSGDYRDTGITNTSNVLGGNVKEALDTLHTRLDSTGSNSLARDTNISGELRSSITGLEYRLVQTGAATVNTVSSIFGRQGAVVGQSGDYSDTGVTNTSSVAGGTVFNALNTLHTRLEATGALASAPVTSVFGRQGTVVGQSGDYSDTGVTNTSNIIGGTVRDGFNTINSRLLATGQAIPNVSDVVRTGDASAKPWNWVIDENNFVSNLDTKVPTQQSTKAYIDSAAPVLVRTGDANVSAYNWVLDQDDMAGNSAVKLPTQQSVKAYVDSVNPILVRTGDASVKNNAWVVDEDNFASNVDTRVPTQQSVKAYVDSLSGDLSNRLKATGENLAPVSSVFNRVGAVVGQSGDYQDTGVTNTSSVIGGTVRDALNSLHTRIESTGLATLNTVSSVFQRQGAVVGQSGDYSDTGITNTSSIVGETVHNAFNTVNTRFNSTGSALMDRDATISGVLNTSITGLEKKLLDTGALVVLKSDYNSGSVLFANVDNTPVNVELGHYSIFGRQGGNGIAINKPSAAELLAGTETDLRAWAPQDVKTVVTHSITGVQFELYQTGSALLANTASTGSALQGQINALSTRIENTGVATLNTVTSVFGRQGVVVGQTGDYNATGVTNVSNVIGGTVHDALNTINTRLKDTGALLNTSAYGSFHFAASDETTALTAGLSKIQILAEYGMDLTETVGYLNVAPTGAALSFDINMSGASIYSTTPSIDTGELTTFTAATQPVATGTYIPSGARLTIDIDQVGSTYGGAGLKIILRGNKR